MNIIIEPFFIGFIQFIISFILLSGLAFSGKYINKFLIPKIKHPLLDIIISIIILSQLLKIIVYLDLFNWFYIFYSFALVSLGILNLKNILLNFHFKNFFYTDSKITILLILLLFFLFLISVAPPTMADALDYHYGIPLYLLKFYQMPDINFWLYGNVGGNGDIFNSIPLYLRTDNFVSVLQFFCFFLFLSFLKNNIKSKNKFIFVSIFILSSPTILQLLSGPKFMILPQIMTALALYFLIKNNKIEFFDFIFISILLMGAAQFKSSFLISGSIIGLLTFIKAFKFNNLKTLFLTFILLTFFFLPTALWNFNQVLNFNFINFFSIMPDPMMENMRAFKENNFIYPLNLFIPSSIGKLSTILGFQIFILLMFINNSRRFNFIFLIIISTIVLHYFLGMNVGRMYYEFILWSSISFIFIKDNNFNYSFYSKLILPQTIIIIIFSAYFALSSFPSFISNELRDNFMKKNTYYYEGIKWVNTTLPEESKIISLIRPVSLYKNEFAPTDILDFELKDYNIQKYLEILKKRKFNFILLIDDSENYFFSKCIGGEFARSEYFSKSTRNPFNRDTKYNFQIHHFNYDLLPDCFQR